MPAANLASNIRSHETEKRMAVVKFRDGTLNVEKRTIDFVMATDTPADFGAYFEVLGMDDGEIRTERLDAGIVPLLDSHPHSQWKTQTIDDQFGVVNEWSKEEGEIIGTVMFATDERSEKAFKKVCDKIVKTGSIGYYVYKHKDMSGPEDKKKTYRAIDWEIIEFSLVSIPRDPNAQSRSQEFEKIKTEIINENKTCNERTLQMPPENQPVDPAVRTSTPADIEAAAAAAQERILDIQAAVRSAGLDESVATDLIKRKLSLGDASKEIFAKMEARAKAESEKQVSPALDLNHGAEASKREARIEAMTTAIEHRVDSSVKVEGLARSFAGMSLFEMQKESLRLEGKDVRTMDKEVIIRQAFQGTSDFPNATQAAVARKVKKGYDYVSQNYQPLVTETSRSDFKMGASVSLGDAPELTKIRENGEFETGTFGESKEQYKIETFGKRIALTRQAIINDDLSLFDKIPYAMGLAGGRKIHKLVFVDILKGNPKMSDNKALFHADHKNIVAAGASLEAELEAMLLALRAQASDKGEFQNYNPGLVIVSSDLEVAARKLVTSTTATKTADVNIWANTIQGVIVEASLAPKTVFLTGRKEEVDMIELAFLNGNKGVNVRQRESANILGVEWDVFMDVGGAPIDYKGLIKGSLT